MLLLLRSTEVRSSILHYDDVLTDHVTTSPLATQEQQLGVLVAGAGLRLDADSTLGCTSSIALLAPRCLDKQHQRGHAL